MVTCYKNKSNEKRNGSFYFFAVHQNLIIIPVNTGRQLHRQIRTRAVPIHRYIVRITQNKQGTDIQLACN